MPFVYTDQIANKKISSVEVTDTRRIVVKFDNSELEIEATTDCCDSSWFEFPEEIDKLTNTILTDISIIDKEFPPVTNAYYHHNEKEIIFHTDNGDIKVNYRHYSNGQYNGGIFVRYNEL
jgi:hypothetical protein